jgi:hypothetical protein
VYEGAFLYPGHRCCHSESGLYQVASEGLLIKANELPTALTDLSNGVGRKLVSEIAVRIDAP